MADTKPTDSNEPLAASTRAGQELAGEPQGKRQPKAVVRSPEREPQGAGGLIDDEATPADAEFPTAGHHHLPSTGADYTPAGAHRHDPFGPAHDHPVPDRGPDSFVVQPTPVSEDDDRRGNTNEDAGVWTVDHDCKAVVDHQLVTFTKGQRVSGATALYLLDTGAPLTPAS